MKHRQLLSGILLWIAFGLPISLHAQSSMDAKTLVTRMLAAIDQANTLSFNLKTYERVAGKEIFNEVFAKVQVRPQRIYLDALQGSNKGVEIIFNPDLYGDKALVNPGRFVPNLKLDPYGSRMRKDQHHTIFSTGFGTLAYIVREAVKRAEKEAKPEEFAQVFQFLGTEKWNGKEFYKLQIVDPTFQYTEYTVKEGETLDKLAKQRAICSCLVIENNSQVKDFSSLSPGMKIKLPSSYAPKTVLLIDKQTFLPLKQVMSDEKGIFERYEFSNVVVNPKFAADEFSDKFSGYRY